MKDRKNPERGLSRVSHLFLSSPAPPKEKVTIQVAAKALGVSKGKIITYLNQGVLRRIRDGDRIYISMAEVRALRDKNDKLQVKSSVSAAGKSYRRASIIKEKEGSKRPLARLGVLENEHHSLLKYKAAVEAKDRELEILKFEINNLKRNLENQATELKGTDSRLRRLYEEQQKELVAFKKATDAKDHEIEKTQTRLLAVEEELERIRRSWLKKLFGDV
jgi:hypothetical protein